MGPPFFSPLALRSFRAHPRLKAKRMDGHTARMAILQGQGLLSKASKTCLTLCMPALDPYATIRFDCEEHSCNSIMARSVLIRLIGRRGGGAGRAAVCDVCRQSVDACRRRSSRRQARERAQTQSAPPRLYARHGLGSTCNV